MSTDYDAICDKCRRFRHLGQEFSSGASFGYGSNDADGQRAAAAFLFKHLSECEAARVVHSGSTPDEYEDDDPD